MTAVPSLIDTAGRRIPLDRKLGSGGEGAVFSITNDLKLVAKVYHRPPNSEIVEKLTTMVRLANPQLLTLAAWPKDLLFHTGSKQLAGFVMPRLSDCQPIQHVYNPVQRLKHYPRAGWNFQVRVARNLAAAFDEVHKAGGLVGDVNQSNVQVSSQALVRLIDCDSFQIRANGKEFLCEVGVAHYIPPELQGKSLRGLVRTENHDRFGLAVLIYQLLFVGRHPYAGVYRGAGDPPFEQLIAEFRFAQGPAAHTWGMSPSAYTPLLADVPPDLGTLFRRAFERGSELNARPRPTEWIAALQQLEKSIIDCSVDPGHKYWRGLKSCTWCRLANNGGPEYYFGVAEDTTKFAVNEARLKEVERRLLTIECITFPIDRSQFTSTTEVQPKPYPHELINLHKAVKEAAHQLSKAKERHTAQENESDQIVIRKQTELREAITLGLAAKIMDLEKDQYETLQSMIANNADKIKSKSKLLFAGFFINAILLVIGLIYYPGLAVVTGLLSAYFAILIGASRIWPPKTPTEKYIAEMLRRKQNAKNEAEIIFANGLNQIYHIRNAEKSDRNATLNNLENTLKAAKSACQEKLASEEHQRRQALRAAASQTELLENEWRKHVEVFLHDRNRILDQLRELLEKCRSLDLSYRRELEQLTAHSEAAARVRHLRLHLLADANISKIGTERKQILMTNGIYTAADIDFSKITSIWGFSEKLAMNLLDWQKEVLSQFRFDPNAMVSPAEHRTVTAKFRAAQQQILNDINQKMSRLEALEHTCRESINKLIPHLKHASALRRQAEADLKLLSQHS